MTNIPELRAYFNGLKTPQKKEFILNLQKKLDGARGGKYAQFLEECVQSYNREARALKKEAAAKPPPPDIASELFAKAIASMLSSPAGPAGSLGTAPGLKAKLAGTWRREHAGKTFFYTFNSDNTFETNETPGHAAVKGHYTVGPGNALLMEPHEALQFGSLMVDPSGRGLTVVLKDGSSREYRKL